MKKHKTDCIDKCTDPSTKKVAKAEIIGVKERTFIYWCRVGCHQFEVKV